MSLSSFISSFYHQQLIIDLSTNHHSINQLTICLVENVVYSKQWNPNTTIQYNTPIQYIWSLPLIMMKAIYSKIDSWSILLIDSAQYWQHENHIATRVGSFLAKCVEKWRNSPLFSSLNMIRSSLCLLLSCSHNFHLK